MAAVPQLLTKIVVEQYKPARFMVWVQYGQTPAVVNDTTTTLANAITMITTLTDAAVIKNDSSQ